MNYEQELQNLKNAQKNAAMADLQSTRDTSLSNLQAEEARIKPEYAAQRSTANANNRVAARNFQEYLANTGRANSGIGAQYEMSRQNNLQSGLNAINAAEAQSLADIARRRTDAQNAYNSGLASANAQVEANYIQNLLNQRQQQWEREFQQKQFDEQVRQYNLNRQDALNKLYASSSGGGSSYGGNSGGSKNTKTTTSNKLSQNLKNLTNNAQQKINYNKLDSELGTIKNNAAATGGITTGALYSISSSNEQMKEKVSDAYNKGLITADQVRQIASKYNLF